MDAILVEIKVLPSPEMEEVMRTTFFSCPGLMYCILVRRERKDSEITDLGCCRATKAVCLLLFPMTPRTGTLVADSIC